MLSRPEDHDLGDMVACPACDLLQRIPPLPNGGKAPVRGAGNTRHPANGPARPPPGPYRRGGDDAHRRQHRSADGALGGRAPGEHDHLGGTLEMWLQGRELTAVIVAFCALIAPATYILFMLTVLLAARRPPAPHWVAELLRWADSMRPWSMIEVMILGILVALIKIAELATVEPGIGMYAVGGLVLLLPAIMINFDPDEIWKRVEWADGSLTPRPSGEPSRIERSAGGTRLLRDVRPAVATRAAGRAGALRALRRRARVAPPPLHPVLLGPPHRRRDLLHPRQRPAGDEHHHAAGHPTPTPSWAE